MSALWADDSRRFWPQSPFSRSAAARRDSRRRSDQRAPRATAAGTTRLGRVPFVLVLIAIFGVGMAGLLALNTTLQGQAFQARALHQQANQLTYQQASLERQVDDLRSVDNLAARAFGLGMRPDPSPGFVELPSGRITGYPKTVQGDEVPGLVKSPEQIKAEREAAEAKKNAAKAKKEAEAARRAAEKKAEKQAEQQQAAQQSASGDTEKQTQQDRGERN